MIAGGDHHRGGDGKPADPVPGVEPEHGECRLGTGVRVAAVGLLPQPASVAPFHRTGGEQVGGADLGRARAGQALPGAGEDQTHHAGEAEGRGVMGEGGDQHQGADPAGMTMGEGLSDGPPHRIADHGHRPRIEDVEYPGQLVRHLAHLEPPPALGRQAMAAMVDEDHPVVLCQQAPDPIPLGQGRPGEAVDQHHRWAVGETGLTNQELHVSHVHRPPGDSPRMDLAGGELGAEDRPEQAAGEDGRRRRPEPSHVTLPPGSPTANTWSVTGMPPTRCSSMMRSITSTVTP